MADMRRTRMAMATPRRCVSSCSFGSSLSGNCRFKANLKKILFTMFLCLTWSRDQCRVHRGSRGTFSHSSLPQCAGSRCRRSCCWRSWSSPPGPESCWPGSWTWWGSARCRQWSRTQIWCCTLAHPEQFNLIQIPDVAFTENCLFTFSHHWSSGKREIGADDLGDELICLFLSSLTSSPWFW